MFFRSPKITLSFFFLLSFSQLVSSLWTRSENFPEFSVGVKESLVESQRMSSVVFILHSFPFMLHSFTFMLLSCPFSCSGQVGIRPNAHVFVIFHYRFGYRLAIVLEACAGCNLRFAEHAHI